MNNQYVIKSALRTLQVLRAFGEAPYRFGLAELCHETSYEKNQLYRSLKTLEAAGFIVADGAGRYEVTPVARQLAGAVPERGTGTTAPKLQEAAD